MKALSIRQPFATLIIIGAKKFETRTWETPHRGPLLIHASSGYPSDLKALCHEEPFKSILRCHGYEGPMDLPLGALIGSCTIEEGLQSLVQCRLCGVCSRFARASRIALE